MLCKIYRVHWCQVGNKILLYRKPCIPEKKLIWNKIRKSWSLFQNPSWKYIWSAPGGEITMTSYSACNKTSLSRKPCILYKTLLRNAIRKSWSFFQKPSFKIAWSVPWRRTDYVQSGRQYNLVISETIIIIIIIASHEDEMNDKYNDK